MTDAAAPPSDDPSAESASARHTTDSLMARLAELDIPVTTVAHPPVFTVEEAKSLRGILPGGHSKNLFLRNKKGVQWLLVCEEDRAVDLKAFSERIGSGRLSFGSPERLMTALGVIPGAVTPFALINDTAGAVQPVLDAGLMAHDVLNFHPLNNSMTTAIGRDGLLRFIEACGHTPQIVDLDVP
ncbi:MAG: prolyl-tRNA synthetase associated domain-containing protein [Rhodospirillaceae bacterium]|nr:prolyl-tRNA synthetase associated domain-containing protein [Rhodospirillaceae bacterium]